MGQDHQHGDTHHRSRFDEVCPGQFPLMHVGEVLGHGENQDQLHPFGRLKVLTTGHFDPAARSQILLAEDHHRHQRAEGGDVHPMNLVEQGLIVQQAEQEHAGDPAADPVELLDVGSGKLGMHGGTLDLHHTQAAKQQDEGQQ